MSVLNDAEIRNFLNKGKIVIEPMPEDIQIQPASVDLRLDDAYIIINPMKIPYFDSKGDNIPDTSKIQRFTKEKPLVLQPHMFVLCQTMEKVKIPPNLLARVEGRSSIGRLGVAIHITAGFIDPGFEGNITLEVVNLNNIPVILYPKQRVCQIVFEELTAESERPYGSNHNKYQGQRYPTPSAIYDDTDWY